jgi:hypothetical protein
MPEKVHIPEWVMDPRLREEAEQMLKYKLKYETFNIEDTILIPEAIKTGPNFDERLREQFDVDKMLEEGKELKLTWFREGRDRGESEQKNSFRRNPNGQERLRPFEESEHALQRDLGREAPRFWEGCL